jgi:hypothetical protein
VSNTYVKMASNHLYRPPGGEYSSHIVTRRELVEALERNSRQLTAALDVWIERAELDLEQNTFSDSLRALCLHRARELYTERALLRLALRRLNAGTGVAHGVSSR